MIKDLLFAMIVLCRLPCDLIWRVYCVICHITGWIGYGSGSLCSGQIGEEQDVILRREENLGSKKRYSIESHILVSVRKAKKTS